MQLISIAVAGMLIGGQMPSEAPTYAGLNTHKAQSMYDTAVAGMRGQTPHQVAEKRAGYEAYR